MNHDHHPVSSSHEGHETTIDKHKGHSTNIFKTKFWVSLALTIPVVLYSDIIEKIFKCSPPQFPGSTYVPLVLGSVVFFYAGWVFLVGAWREIRGRLPGMMTLIGIAITAAYLWSVYAVFADEEALFWELTTLVTIMLLGHWLEMRAVSGAQGALKELSKLLPDTAEVMRDDNIEIIPLAELTENDIVLVKPGGKIPADGVIVDGHSDVNESMITGESKPVSKKQGDTIIAGTINGDGALKITVAQIGEKTFLAGVMRLVAEAQASKSRLQILSDKAALYLTIIAVTGGIITFVSWLIAGKDVAFAVGRLVAVLVVACPHALGLAVPLVASISTTKAAQNGFLVKQRLALEAARTINTVLFDKTGTLTTGTFGVDAVVPMSSSSEQEVLTLAASVNGHSEHSIAKAITNEAIKRNISLLEVTNFQRIAGKGARGESRIKSQESRIFVGSSSLMRDFSPIFDNDSKKQATERERQGKTVIWVASQTLIHDSRFIIHGFITLTDIIREESREAVKTLKKIGLKTAMITGDSEDVAKWVSKELEIDEYFARVLPHQKSEKVKELQERGLRVAMVGDGINDAPALTQANLGIAIGAGTNVAIESAGIILVKNDPRDIVKIVTLSRLTYAKMIQNLFWATGYNVVALPLAAGVLASKGILLEPAIAAVFMSLSTVIVAINAMLLKKKVL